jgi:hypothetical protein
VALAPASAPAGALVLLILAAAASGGCRAPLQETRRLDFDAVTTSAFVGSGWSSWERRGPPNSMSFSWAVRREATVRLVSRADGDRLVRVRAWSAQLPQGRVQKLGLRLNGVFLAERELGLGPAVDEVVVPAALWLPGNNELVLSFRHAEAPADHLPDSEDGRTLAAGVDWIEVLPYPVDPRYR